MSKRYAAILGVVIGIALLSSACGSDGETVAAPAAPAKPVGHSHGGTNPNNHRHGPNETKAAVELRQDMRKLWEDHVTWTRQFIVSAVAGLPDTDAAAERLLQNQADIGDAVAVFYGHDAGRQLTELLREHILIAADLVASAKAADTAGFETTKSAWYLNADEIARFLADANPAWPLETLTDMMREHLDDTLAEASARLSVDWAADIAAYERIHVHILKMADALAAGIVEQFPDRFKD